MSVLEFQEIGYHYMSGGHQLDILRQANYKFEKEKLYTIVGPSGSGKTTTLTLAGGLDSPQSGKVLFDDKDIKEIGYTFYRNQHVSIVFQAFNLLP